MKALETAMDPLPERQGGEGALGVTYGRLGLEYLFPIVKLVQKTSTELTNKLQVLGLGCGKAVVRIFMPNSVIKQFRWGRVLNH